MNVSQTHTVFIVDDDEAVRSALQCLANAIGWKAKVFACGSECLDAVCDGQLPDCFLLDLNMKEMTGADIQQILLGLIGDVSIVAMTGEPDSPLVERVRRAGAKDVLFKPFKDDELQLALERSVACIH